MKNHNTSFLSTKSLSIGYRDGKLEKCLLSDLSLNLKAGQLTVVLGINGAGKSTLLRTLARMQNPLAGEVLLNGKPHQTLTALELAKTISTVLTDKGTPAQMTASELVALGRYPYTGWSGKLSAADDKAIAAAMELTQSSDLANEQLGALSDGQRQRLFLARAIAQETPVILLDEPTAHLDVPARLHTYSVLQELAKNHQKAILISSHAYDLALNFADELWLMHPNKVEVGLPEDLVLQGALEKVYHNENIAFDYTSGTFVGVATKAEKRIAVAGEEPQATWTKRALQRNGFAVVEQQVGVELVFISKDSTEQLVWKTGEVEASSIADLLSKISKG